MFKLFKKNEFEIISKKIKNINHKIIEKFNINETEKLSKLSQKNRDKRIEEIIKSLSGQNFSKVFAYSFSFEELPMFRYLISFYENNYELSVSGIEDFKGFKCDYLLNENVFRLTLKSDEEVKEDENDFKRLVGNKTFDIVNKIKKSLTRKK